MTLQTAIGIIRFSTIVTALCALGGMALYFLVFKDMEYLIVAGILVIVGIAIALGKASWTRYIIRKIKYPGVLYGVCDSMGYFRGLSINVSDDVLDDLYKPTYDTETFLNDNKLQPDIYISSLFSSVFGTIVWLIPMAALLLLENYHATTVTKYITLFLCLCLFAPIKAYLKKVKSNQWGVALSFGKDGLLTTDALLLWTNIYSWERVPPTDRNKQEPIEFRLNEPVNGNMTYTLIFDNLAVSATDLYVLLTHYKYKYGYSE